MALISTLAGVLGGTVGAGGTAAATAATAAGTGGATAGGLSGLLGSLGGTVGGSTGATIGSTIGSGLSSAGSAIAGVLPEAVTSAATTAGEAIAGIMPELSLGGLQEAGLSGLLDSAAGGLEGIGLETLGKGVGLLGDGVGAAGEGLSALDGAISSGTNALLDPIASGIESGTQAIGLDQPLSMLGDKVSGFGDMLNQGIDKVTPTSTPMLPGDTLGQRMGQLPGNLGSDIGQGAKNMVDNYTGFGEGLQTPAGRQAMTKSFMHDGILDAVDDAPERAANERMEAQRLQEIEDEKRKIQTYTNQYGLIQ